MLNRIAQVIVQYHNEIGIFVAALAAILIYLTLRANHDWNRRQFAIKMIENWNKATSEHRRAIEKSIPGLVDVDKKSHKVIELTMERATQIYLSKPGDNVDWELRFHMIELLNYFEFVATAYLNHVGDRKIIEESFKDTLINQETIYKNFVKVVGENRGYEPWKPYTDLVNRWKTVHRWLRRKTA
jgi:hypothetical protein